MTRWAMVADLRRCVGCQTCTAACKQKNATPPGVQWRRVLDLEIGEYPSVKRAFVPVGCMHCDDPPCLDVCPSTATRKRADGIVTIDESLCIGCAYCAVACPYEARYKSNGVATKCTFCVERIDAGTAKGLTPGVDPEATPACVNSCIAGALHFGDVEDPASNVSQLLAEHQHFRLNEAVGTGPRFYYLWDKAP
jgi:phenylacetyl-CoA:acceptor oxidoreductase 27-kDa subunit